MRSGFCYSITQEENMGWFNYVGLIIIVLIMVPNVVYALKHRSQGNTNVPTYVVVLENLGRYASMFFLVFNIPNTWFSFFVPNGMLFISSSTASSLSLMLPFLSHFGTKRAWLKLYGYPFCRRLSFSIRAR